MNPSTPTPAPQSKPKHTPAFLARIDEIIRQGRPSDHLWNHCVDGRDDAMREHDALTAEVAKLRAALEMLLAECSCDSLATVCVPDRRIRDQALASATGAAK